MARYNETPIRINRNQERYLSTRNLPIIEPRDTDVFIIGKMGQTLPNLAHKYYNDVNLWWVIARANPDCFDGGIAIKPGKEYRIPADLSQIGREIVSGGGLLGSSNGGY